MARCYAPPVHLTPYLMLHMFGSELHLIPPASPQKLLLAPPEPVHEHALNVF